MTTRFVLGLSAFLSELAGLSAGATSVGVCAHVTRDEFDDRIRTYEMMSKAGFTDVRSDFDWCACQRTKGAAFDFSKYDMVVNDAMEHGIAVLPILYGIPSWAQPVNEHLDEWRTFIRETMRHFKGRVPAVEIWNEENIDAFWKNPDPAKYAEVLKAAYEEVKKVDPSVRVVFGGTAGCAWKYIEQAVLAGAKDSFDVVSVHPYRWPHPPEPELTDDLLALKRMMARNGIADRSVWITELGWPTHKADVPDAPVLCAGLKVARPGKTSWNAAYVNMEKPGSSPEDYALALTDVLPKGSTCEVVTARQLNERLPKGDFDLVVYPFDESYPDDTVDAVVDFVRQGGTLVAFGGYPLYYPYRAGRYAGSSPQGAKEGFAARGRLRIAVDAWWDNEAIPRLARTFPSDAAKAVGLACDPAGLPADRFFSGRLLRQGDRMISLLVGEDKRGAPAVGACVYAFDSDLKGRVVLSSRGKLAGANTEDEQARYTIGALEAALRNGVEKYFIYEFRSVENQSSYSEDHFGIVHRDFAPKPAYDACKSYLDGSRKGPVESVNPLIGTESKRADAANAAGMQPFVGVPFGMWQWTAMTQLSELGKVSYDDSCKRFLGFIGTRQPAPWMGEYGQISLMPQVGEVDCDYQTRGVEFDKAKSVFKPYYCKIVQKNGIVGEVTGSSRTAMMRFTFPKGERGKLVIDASREFIAQFSDTNAAAGWIDIGDRTRKRFCAWNDDRADAKLGPPLKNCRAHFRIETSRPYSQCGIYEGAESRGADGYRTMRKRPGGTSVTGNVCGAWLEFEASDEPLFVKVSQSMIDLAQADETMRREAGDGFEFDRVCARARAEWERKLSVIDIDADDDVKTIFYTGMYHALQFPREFGEYGRYYSAFDDRVHDGDSYTSYSLWDTYRAEHAFLCLAAPERVDGMVNALLQMSREGGWLPKWPNPAYTGIMVGGPAEIVIAQAWQCGFRGFDLKEAYAAVRRNATVPSAADSKVSWTGRELWAGAPEGRGGLTTYQALGYVAADRTEESVSRTLDFGHDDLAVAVLADAVGKPDEAAAFRKRAKNYRNLWNAARGKFWPRKADGTWVDRPRVHWNHTDYTEQSPETAVWGVPYDVEGVAELVGGRERMVSMLDEYFGRIYYNKNGGEMTHHENEPTHHIAYLYAALDEHDKCAKHVRQILTRGYSSERWGMEGNDDCGQMSAWYILSAMGFYPLDPTTGEYVIGSPLVRKATLRIGAPFKSATFTVVAKNQSKENCLVKSVKLNGVELKERRIRHADILKGGTLEFEMANR